jgi:hypothetical protein
MPCAPRMAGCSTRCLHRQLVEDYRAARAAAELAAERTHRGYPTERAELAGRLITFRRWLEGSRRG